MKRLLALFALSVVLLTVTACGGDHDVAWSPGLGVNTSVSGGCGGLNYDDNLTTEQIFAGQDEWIAAFAELDPAMDTSSYLAEARASVTGTWGPLIAATPKGGQGDFFYEACAETLEAMEFDISSTPGVEGVLIASGYATCELIRNNPNGPSQDNIADEWTILMRQGSDEVMGPTMDRTHELLCPQLPYTPSADSRSTEQSGSQTSGDCSATLEGSDGTVAVTTGSLECSEAVEVIMTAYGQILADGGRHTTLTIDGATAWLCGFANTAGSEVPDYDFKCDTPMGDIFIAWTAD